MEAAAWVNLSDDELLEKKISQLGLKLDGTELQPIIQQLYDELSQISARFFRSNGWRYQPAGFSVGPTYAGVRRG